MLSIKSSLDINTDKTNRANKLQIFAKNLSTAILQPSAV